MSTLPINSAADESAKRAEEISNVAWVRAAFEAWTAGTGSPFELLAENVSWKIIGGTTVSKTYATRDAFNREVTQPFNSRMGGPLLPSVPTIYGTGSSVAIHFTASGTARDGKPYSNEYAWFFEMSGGKVLRVVAFVDAAAFNELWTRVTPKEVA